MFGVIVCVMLCVEAVLCVTLLRVVCRGQIMSCSNDVLRRTVSLCVLS